MPKKALIALSAQLLPDLSWRRRVTAATLRADFAAALVGALIVVPQGIAFATLAGLPPQYGLYAAMVPAAVAALFGSSWHLVSGPTNAISLVVFATLAPLATPGSPAYVELALKLCFLVGAIQLVMGLARMGTLLNFVSHTVVVGFTAGAGVLIIVNQLGNFLGIPLPQGGGTAQTLIALGERLRETDFLVLAVGSATLAAGLATRRYAPRVPYMIVAIVVGGAMAWCLRRWLGTEAAGLRVLGPLPGAIPRLTVPAFDAATLHKLLGVAVAVALLGLVEASAIARAIALRSGQRIDGNREFVGQGLSNLAGSFFGAYPSSGSFNRSGANADAGAQTPIAAIASAVLLVPVLYAVSPLLAHLPFAAMAALLLMVAWNLIDWRSVRHIARASRAEAVVLAVSFLATLLVELELAVLLGVTVSLVLYLHRTAQPALRTLAPDPADPGRKFRVVASPGLECPQLKFLRVEGSLYFGAVAHVAEALDEVRAAAPRQVHLVLMAKGMNFVDVSGADLLAQERSRRRADGGDLYLHGLRPDAARMLERSGYLDRGLTFERKEALLRTLVPQLDPGTCAGCRARIFLECARQPGASS